MDSEQKTFIFLSEDEYRVLAVKDKAAYLVRAQQELALSQQLLRKLTDELRKEQLHGVGESLTSRLRHRTVVSVIPDPAPRR